ncbi:MAG: hypothetical protein K2W95_32810 [Candidatus Obscuribacterales bacterium]|nr:hypothetical protein [Candidatus Obscuribacterales bacterium]
MGDDIFQKLKAILFGKTSQTRQPGDPIENLGRSGNRDANRPEQKKNAATITKLMSQGRDYQIYIGVPLDRPTQWTKALQHGDELLLQNEVTDLAQVRAFIFAYPSGQIVSCELGNLGFPPGISGLEPTPGPRDSHVLLDSDLKEGRLYVQITYGKSAENRTHYSTEVLNKSTGRLRVTKFGGYTPVRRGVGYKLNTITGKYFSAEEFREWYGQAAEWLEPGQSATDPNNCGSPPMLWAYYCETDDGHKFVAGEVLSQLP